MGSPLAGDLLKVRKAASKILPRRRPRTTKRHKEGKNGAEFEGGWTPAKFQGLAKYIDAHPEKLKMPRSEFDQLLSDASKPRQPRTPPGTPEP